MPDPDRRLGAIHVFGIELVHTLGCIRLEIAFVGQQLEAGRRQSPDHVGFGVGFLGQQFGGDDAGGIAYPLDVEIGVVGFDGFLESRQFVGLDGGINQQFSLGLGQAGHTGRDDGAQQQSNELGLVHRGTFVY